MSGLALASSVTITRSVMEDGSTPESLANKESNYVSTGFIFLGLLSTGIARPKSINAFDELNAMPSDTVAQMDERARRSAELRRSDVLQAKRNNSWLAHTIPVVLASIAGTTLAIRHDDPWLGLSSFASTVIVTEIRIWLRPEFATVSSNEDRSQAPLISIAPYFTEDGLGQGLALMGRF